ncbi:MAG: hypothetical protein AAGG48_22150 [Planctomycetota bacterium]
MHHGASLITRLKALKQQKYGIAFVVAVVGSLGICVPAKAGVIFPRLVLVRALTRKREV